MGNSNLLQHIKMILSKQLSIDVDSISEESILTADLGADSLDIAEIALEIKEKFEYDFNDAEMQQIKTVGDIYEILKSRKAEKKDDAKPRIFD